MKKKFALLAIVAAFAALVAGCGQEKAAQPSTPPKASAPAASEHSGHSQTMPKEDPFPVAQDMKKVLADITAQVNAGQIMEAQKSVGNLEGLSGRLLPHMMDEGLKNELQQATKAVGSAINTGKVDGAAVEKAVQAADATLQKTVDHLKTMSH